MPTVLIQLVLVFGSFVLHFLSTGISQSFGVMYSELVSVFEIGEGEIGFVASLFTGLLLGTGLVSGVLITVVGVCVTTIAGSLLMTVGMVTSGLVTSPYLLYLTYGVVGGCGASLLMISGSIIINQRFTDRRTIAMGVGSIGGAIGNIVLPLFTSWCIDVYNWRGTFILLGGLCLQGVIAGVAFYSGDNIETSDDKKEKLAEVNKASPVPRCRRYFAFFNSNYICFLIGTSIAVVGYFIPYNLLYNLMIHKGQTREHSSMALSLVGVGGIISRVLVGLVGDYKCCHRIYYFIFAVILSAFTSAACVHLMIFWQYFLCGFLYGMGTGAFVFLMSVITTDLVGVEHVGPAFGFLTTTQGIAASIGTPISGWLADATSSYDISFYFSGACFLCCCLLLVLNPSRWHCTKPKHQTNSTNKTEENTMHVK